MATHRLARQILRGRWGIALALLALAVGAALLGSIGKGVWHVVVAVVLGGLAVNLLAALIWSYLAERSSRTLTEVHRRQNWIYVLVGAYPPQAGGVIGCFQTNRIGRDGSSVTATGRAYWVKPHITLRGEWTTKQATHDESSLAFHYTMTSPADGEAWHLTRPSRHQGLIDLSRQDETTPAIGTACFSGPVHDLYEWRNNTPSMYTESVAQSWDELVEIIESEGVSLYETLARKLGAR